MAEIVLAVSTENTRARESTLFIWVLHLKLKPSTFAVLKWAVVVDKYLSVGIIHKCRIYSEWTFPVHGVNATVDSMFFKFGMTGASLGVTIEHKPLWTKL